MGSNVPPITPIRLRPLINDYLLSFRLILGAYDRGLMRTAHGGGYHSRYDFSSRSRTCPAYRHQLTRL
jgi:hypothetical protein